MPFSTPFYRWLLNEEHSIGLVDLEHVAPEVQKTLVRLKHIVQNREWIKQDTNLDSLQKKEKVCVVIDKLKIVLTFYKILQIELLSLDGCVISDLGLDFVLPGHPNIELRRGGRDIPVTIHNLHQYISLVSHWFLFEGVQKQFDAFREGKFCITFITLKFKLLGATVQN